jgi:hypothetical protein
MKQEFVGSSMNAQAAVRVPELVIGPGVRWTVPAVLAPALA